jgi:hypothetical protein
VSGTYTQSGTLSLHASATGSDRLAVTGSAALGGTLAVNFSAAPANGSTFTVLTASPVTGAFATTNVSGLAANQSALVSYSNGSVTLRIAASYPVTATASGHGTITPASQQVLSGNAASFTLTPNTGFEVASVTGDHCTVTQQGTSNTWISSAITQACAVTAVFADYPSQCTGAKNYGPSFFDDFSGTALDPAKWFARTRGGNVVVADNSVAVSGGSAGFPYVASVGSPILPTGDFSVRWIATYGAQSNYGTGSLALTDMLSPNGTSGTSIADAWQDGTNYRVEVSIDATAAITPAYAVTSPAPIQHDVEYCWLDNSIEVWVDGQMKFQAARNVNVVRPAALWFGNPGATFTGPWQPFTLNYVEVRALNDIIFKDGFGTP